jgi:hypothetical protein
MECKEFHHWLENRDIKNEQESLGIMAHRSKCTDCHKLYTLDTKAEQGICLAFAQKKLPRNLVHRIDAYFEMAPSFFNRFKGKIYTTTMKHSAWLLGIMVLAIMTAGMLILRPPSFKNIEQISEQAVREHLKGDRQISFDSATLHQALDMFKKELKFNVLLPDLKALGCFLVGGRLCTLGKCRAAYFVIERGGKKGSLFIMDMDYLDYKIADKSRFSTNIKGCATQVWKENGQVYAMVF